jgi:predicted phosphodiesterase
VDDREPTIEIDMSGIGVDDAEPAPRIYTAAGTRTHLVLSDIHVPYEDKAVNAAVREFARDLKPHGVTFNGDAIDLLEISRHSQASVAKLEGRRFGYTFDKANEYIDALADAAGSQCDEWHWVAGNHERRIDTWLASGDNAVFIGEPGFSVAERLHFDRRGMVDHGPYPEAGVKLGHLLVTHGQWTGQYAAAKHFREYGCPVLVGHVHTPGMYYGSGYDTQRAAWVAGMLGDMDSAAMDYKKPPRSWAHGFAVVHVRKSGAFQCQLHNFWDKTLFVGGKQYGGTP